MALKGRGGRKESAGRRAVNQKESERRDKNREERNSSRGPVIAVTSSLGKKLRGGASASPWSCPFQSGSLPSPPPPFSRSPPSRSLARSSPRKDGDSRRVGAAASWSHHVTRLGCGDPRFLLLLLLHAMSELEAGQHPSRRQVELRLLLNLLFCLFLVWTKEIAALADFSGYLTKLLQNHTVYACDGDRLSLQCPRHSTISVQSAYYGQAYPLCSTQQPEVTMKEPLNCVASTTLQKVLDECQNLRACHLLVNSRVFGPDLCPGITKYLLVSFKCKPTEYKTRSVCENEELKLHCKESKFLNIYSATYGRSSQEKNVCSTEIDRHPQFDCFSYRALEVLSKKCYGKQRCKITANNHNFGRPCLPGVKKYLNVSYACDTNFDLKESRFPQQNGIIVSNSLAAFAYIKDHPERAALLFVSSVCVGIVLTLCALVIHVSCSNDFGKLQRMREHLMPEGSKADEDSGPEEDEEEEQREESSDSDFPDDLTGFYRTSYSAYCSMDQAELAERIERREQIIQEIWLNSGLDASPTRSFSPFSINEQQCICFG
ncbi:protein eva-1 homolog C isoform X2 [Hemicordylus capensis]|uniref:protein eva-1 homolog C isoform X2 n=1 Tax=Hemicordylus capensis TaxID=884348 RepID=UPI0023047CD2|nr:protein eva-1 homolog C isoform X2 [Hemicordylus capensis]